jgi:hypothetical protein
LLLLLVHGFSGIFAGLLLVFPDESVDIIPDEFV